MIQYWDMRTPNPIAQLTAPERVYALDAVNDLMVSCVRVSPRVLLMARLGVWNGGQADLSRGSQEPRCDQECQLISGGILQGADLSVEQGIPVEDADEGDYGVPVRRWVCCGKCRRTCCDSVSAFSRDDKIVC